MREKGGGGVQNVQIYNRHQMQRGQIIGLLEREQQFTSTTDENSSFMYHI